MKKEDHSRFSVNDPLRSILDLRQLLMFVLVLGRTLIQEPTISVVFIFDGFLNAYRKVGTILISFEPLIYIARLNSFVEQLHKIPTGYILAFFLPEVWV